VFGEEAGEQAEDADHQRHQREVAGHHPPADVVGRAHLQAVGTERPLRSTAEVAEGNEQRGEVDHRRPGRAEVGEAERQSAVTTDLERAADVALAEPRADDRAETRADSPRGQQQADATVLPVVHRRGQHRQLAHHRGADAECRLAGNQRQHHVVFAGVVHRLADVGHRPHRPPVGVRSLLHRAAHHREQRHRQGERHGVGDECCVAAEGLAEHAAERGSDGEHHSPGRPEQGVRLAQLVGVAGEVGYACVDRRLHERGQRGDGPLEHEQRPHAMVVGGQQAERGHRLQQRYQHQQASAVETVGHRAGYRRGEERRQRERHEGERHQERAAGGLLDDAGDGDEREPVAHERHHLRHEQPAQVGVLAQ